MIQLSDFCHTPEEATRHLPNATTSPAKTTVKQTLEPQPVSSMSRHFPKPQDSGVYLSCQNSNNMDTKPLGGPGDLAIYILTLLTKQKQSARLYVRHLDLVYEHSY